MRGATKKLTSKLFDDILNWLPMSKPSKLNGNLILKYKIANTYEDYVKTGKLIIQSRRGGAYSYLTPQQVMADAHFMKGLHPLDTAIIMGLCFKNDANEKHNSKLQHLTNDLSCKYQLKKEDRSQAMVDYIFEDISSGDIFKISKQELASCMDFIKCIDPKDCLAIGYSMGFDHIKLQQSMRS